MALDPKLGTFLIQPPAPQLATLPPAPQLATLPPDTSADPAPATTPPATTNTLPATTQTLPATTPAATKLPATSRSRNVIDTLAYGLDRLVKPVLALGLIGVGGAELFGPDILSSITVAPEMATLMFFGGFGFFGINLRNQETSK